MKFILIDDRLKVEDSNKSLNSGSINYYLIDVEYNDAWNNLVIEGIMAEAEGQFYSNEGISLPVSNGKVFIDKKTSGQYGIGFKGFTLEFNLTTDTVIDPEKTYYTRSGEEGSYIYTKVENPVVADIGTYYEATKNYQISTQFFTKFFDKGAGEIVTQNEDLPEPTQWESYIAQIQIILQEMQIVVDEADTIDFDINKEGTITTITLTKKDGSTKTVQILDGEKGDKGDPGEKGETGTGIQRITKTGTVGLIDTYTILFTDGTSTTYTVTNGEKGDKGDPGKDGADGKDGVDGKDGTDGADGNGIVSIIKTSTSGLVDTYTITYTNGNTTTYTVTNGEQGPKGEDGKDYVITQQDYNAIAGVVENDIQPTLSNIQNTAETANNTANTAKSIAEGANQALSYGNYSTMISAFNALPSTTYKVGQNMYIVTREVPDLWISEIAQTSQTYTYVDDATFVSDLATNGYVQVGYYKLSALETQKVDLTHYIEDDDYMDTSNAGIAKLLSGGGIAIDNTHSLYTEKATDVEIAAKSNNYKVITPSNLDYAVRSVQPATTEVASPSSTQSLEDNTIYDITISSDITFTLPQVSDTTIFHMIEIRASISNSPTINLGTTYYLGDEPDLSNGDWIIYYEYIGGHWRVGTIEGISGV